MDVLLSVENLSKNYGHRTVLNGISFEVGKGSVLGILGPNGSGKTTLLEIILGVNPPSAGRCKLFGQPSISQNLRRVGAIIEQPNFYPYLSGYQNLEIACMIKDTPNDRIAEVLDLVGLLDRKDEKFKNFSLGMKQRLAVASALLSNPELLILDEPTNGLDPQGIADIRNLFKRVAIWGTTVIITSHLLSELEQICTDLIVLKAGKMLFNGRMADALREDQNYYEISSDDFNELAAELQAMADLTVFDIDILKITIELSPNLTITQLSRRLFSKGIVLSSIVHRKKTLEDYFLDLTSLR